MTVTGDTNGRRESLGTRLSLKKPLMRAMQFGTYITFPKPGTVVDRRQQSNATAMPKSTDSAKGI